MTSPPSDAVSHFGLASARDLVWAHAVNSGALLEAALADDSGVHMLEVDLMLSREGVEAQRDGRVVRASDVLLAHPLPSFATEPDVSRASDLDFETFVRAIVAHVRAEGARRIGVKLDFKELSCVEPCVARLKDAGVGAPERRGFLGTGIGSPKRAAALAATPLWLNADVVRGPGGRDPIDGERFVDLCAAACPTATLSLGWTHTGTPWLGYTRGMIDEMMSLLARVEGSKVTLAASAAHLFASARGPRDAIVNRVRDGGGGTAGGVERATTTTTTPEPFNLEMDDDDAEDAVPPPPVAPKPHVSFTLWGPSTAHIDAWAKRTLERDRTYVDVKRCDAKEAFVLGAYGWLRPAYARFA